MKLGRTYLLYVILFFLPLAGCGSMLCTKGDSNQGLFFDFGSLLGHPYVEIGGSPSFNLNESYVKKLFVDSRGFLLVSSYKTVHCDNREEMRKDISSSCRGHRIIEKYRVRRYRKQYGYEEWESNDIPEVEWKTITDIDDSFSKKPTYHYENCRYSLFGGFYQLIQAIRRI